MVHLVAISHGFMGMPSHVVHIVESLQKKPELHILNTTSNSFVRSMDGIDVCGERFAREIMDEIQKLKPQEVTKLSVVGYSLGGLITRYAVARLFVEGIFDTVKPMNFVTFATPHLGVRRPASIVNDTFNWFAARLTSYSGQQMFLEDTTLNGRPILEVMSDPNQVFMTALKMFEKHATYANLVNDRTVPFWSASINDNDATIVENPIERKSRQYPNIVAVEDNSEEVLHKRWKLVEADQTAGEQQPAATAAAAAEHNDEVAAPSDSTPLLLSQKPASKEDGGVVAVIVPILLLPGLLILGILLGLFSMFSRVTGAYERRKIVHFTTTDQVTVQEAIMSSESAVLNGSSTNNYKHIPETTDDPKALLRRRMLQNLNKLPWFKVIVSIPNSPNTHGAIIVRSNTMLYQKGFFAAGYDVVGYFVETFAM